jgi:hypothetical protein
MSPDLPFQGLSFAGHETFAPRSLWPKKGYDAAREDPEVFGREDAMIGLGVGKNMVRSIRHWGLCFGLLEEVPETRGRAVRPTALGDRLLGDTGFDPFLEDAGTLWWLHWRLVRNLDRATAATWLFARPRGGRFTRDELVAELEGLIREHRSRAVPRTSLKRDVEVLLRVYVRPGVGRAGRGGGTNIDEDALDSPLCALGIVRYGTERGTFELVVGPHPTLPDAVLAAAIFEYAATARNGERTIPLHALLYAPLSPGRVFRLTEDALASRLSRLQAAGLLDFDETAGLRQILLPDTAPDPLDLLEESARRGERAA